MIFIGDIHGQFSELSERISTFSDQIFIQVGDFGLGYNDYSVDIEMLKEFNEELKTNNNQLYVLRGNHDNPIFWNEDSDYSNLHLVKDYTKITIEGKDVLFVGGGVSIDRCFRRKDISWWEGEEIIENTEFDKKCDILVTHVPLKNRMTRFIPLMGMHTFFFRDDTLDHDLRMEQELLEKIYSETHCKYMISGHMHQSDKNINCECSFIVLDINEMWTI